MRGTAHQSTGVSGKTLPLIVLHLAYVLEQVQQLVQRSLALLLALVKSLQLREDNENCFILQFMGRLFQKCTSLPTPVQYCGSFSPFTALREIHLRTTIVDYQ